MKPLKKIPSKDVSFYIGIEGRPTPIIRHEMKPAACPLSLAISCPMPNPNFKINRPRRSAFREFSNKKLQATHPNVKLLNNFVGWKKSNTPLKINMEPKKKKMTLEPFHFQEVFFRSQPLNFRVEYPPSNLGSPQKFSIPRPHQVCMHAAGFLPPPPGKARPPSSDHCQQCHVFTDRNSLGRIWWASSFVQHFTSHNCLLL